MARRHISPQIARLAPSLGGALIQKCRFDALRPSTSNLRPRYAHELTTMVELSADDHQWLYGIRYLEPHERDGLCYIAAGIDFVSRTTRE